jgi:hypothetical protein
MLTSYIAPRTPTLSPYGGEGQGAGEVIFFLVFLVPKLLLGNLRGRKASLCKY